MRERIVKHLAAFGFLCMVFAAPAHASATFYSSDPTVTYSSLTAGKKIDLQVMNFIKAATRTLDLAVYNLTHPTITDSLIAAHRKGVRVRVVTDADNWNEHCQRLVDNGVTVVKGAAGSSHHMHHKFIVRDSSAVLTGSYNFTWNGARTDKNTIVVFKYAQALAHLYTQEFEQMFVKRNFGVNKTNRSARSGQRVTIGTTTRFDVTVYFSPGGGAADALVAQIDRADTSLYFSIFTFVSKRISDAVIRAQNRGVRVYGAFDRDQNNSQTYSKFAAIKAAGCNVRLDNLTAYYGGLLHDKIATIDHGYNADGVAIIGSFNWTDQADEVNDENLVVIHRPTSARSLKTHAYNAYTRMAE